MNANPGREKAETKKAYAKPAVKRVHLKPEEAVLGACKASGYYGPNAGNCTPLGSCSLLGS
jgi:hypothetical protein